MVIILAYRKKDGEFVGWVSGSLITENECNAYNFECVGIAHDCIGDLRIDYPKLEFKIEEK